MDLDNVEVEIVCLNLFFRQSFQKFCVRGCKVYDIWGIVN